MGLTIHYSLKTKSKSPAKVRAIVERIRQLAMDLPFERVGEIIDLEGNDCDYENYRGEGQDSIRWTLIQCGSSVKLPWTVWDERDASGSGAYGCKEHRLIPERVIAIEVWPGHGCEPMNIGFVTYPSEVEVEYDPRDDRKFFKRYPGERPFWSYDKFDKWADKQRPGQLNSASSFIEKRTIKTRQGGWSWGSFCKTQYASDPACGGVPNFLRCHISAITLLERIAEIPGVTVEISDEGCYGSYSACPDYREADAEGRERVYQDYPGKHNVAELIKEIGEWNELIATGLGAMKDAMGGNMEAPIFGYQNFEQLEFHGTQNPDLKPFLDSMAELAKQKPVA